MDKAACDPDADSGGDIGRAVTRFQQRLQRDVQSWLANESGSSERRRDVALDLGIQPTKAAIGGAKKLGKPTPPPAPTKLMEGKRHPFSMSYDGLTTARRKGFPG